MIDASTIEIVFLFILPPGGIFHDTQGIGRGADSESAYWINQ